MRRNSSTIVVLAGPIPDEVLTATARSMNVALIRPEPNGNGNGLEVAAQDARDSQGPDFYLGPLRSARPHRVSLVAATDPAQQAVGVLHALASLRHGPWWPPPDDLIATARNFYPGSLAEGAPTPM